MITFDIIPAYINAFIFVFLAVLHVYWVLGGEWGIAGTIPTDSNGRRIFVPRKGGTLFVALGLFLFAGINLMYIGFLQLDIEESLLRYAIIVVGAIFLLRAIGDFRYVGITKRFTQTTFAVRDKWIYTPLCLLLVLGHILLLL
ncbi:DUF3995 domain-containing protein [Sphingobacterium spiritivorum]|uniref:DUF3995 domain-containing protein n=1 Tax=Sphingobacterium TaxID=28453 RepID=UPI0025E09E1E|nr:MULTISPECIES: DUF3995 domain-containing protein [unclassified Sphingobacterium]